MSNIAETVRGAGIVGAGGAGFPTHVKLSGRAEWVIGNGAECEPLLRIDQQVARLYARKLVRGLRLAAEAVGATRVGVAIKHKHHDTIAAVRAAAEGTPVEIYELEDYYPAGDEFNIVYEVTGRIIPEGGRPADVGCVVQNIVTLVQIAEAVDEGRPVTSRWITLGGGVANPITVETPIGASFAFCLAAAGGATASDYVVIDGGPMMGKFVDPASAFVTRRTSSFLVFPRDHLYVQRRLKTPDNHQRIAKSACDQCNLCTDFCPRYLLGHRCWPSKVMRSGLSATPIPTDVLNASLCCECGLCSLWACPIPLPVREMMVQTRFALKKHEVKSPFRNTDVTLNEFFQNRKVPVKALVERLGLHDYDRPAPMQGMPLSPGRVRLPLNAHAGSPAIPARRVGDTVRTGDVVGEIPNGALGARCHAPIDGKILSITGQVVEIGQ
jgi:Na+-translocating ferredoxin:NAD+ oxidoreductase RnfC subunit